MNFLTQQLGLNEVAADPNALPDGKYDGVVTKSVLVYVDSKDTLSHVITYKVTEGDRKGAQKDEWFTIGKEPRLKDGSTPAKGEVNPNDLASLTPTMSEAAKPWYKKRYTDLGFAEADVDNGSVGITDLVGILVTFGVKKKDGYTNINFVEVRGAVTESAPVSLNVDSTVSPNAVELDF